MLRANALLRNEPVQARSTARLTALLDAAAASIDAKGFERLTTAMVAERAGASIGTVYRYFPDRIAVLKAVSLRAIDRFSDAAKTAISAASNDGWGAGVDAILDTFEKSFRSEPAFASLRFGDPVDLRPRESDSTGLRQVIDSFANEFAAKYGGDSAANLAEKLEIALTIADGLYALAFTFNAKGDASIIAKAREAVHANLSTTLTR